VTIHRLSPKNQVTIPREARALSGRSGAKLTHLRGKRHVVRKPANGDEFRVLLLMTEEELQAREQRILGDAQLNDDQKFEYVTRLNDEMKVMAIDAQNRLVLPAEYVAHLGVGEGRDVKFVCTNAVIQLWNPDHHQRYSGKDPQPAYDPVLTKYLSL
jgi:DNA-binding transcriptional regulator/RsmH inhibitor MraZ